MTYEERKAMSNESIQRMIDWTLKRNPNVEWGNKTGGYVSYSMKPLKQTKSTETQEEKEQSEQAEP